MPGSTTNLIQWCFIVICWQWYFTAYCQQVLIAYSWIRGNCLSMTIIGFSIQGFLRINWQRRMYTCMLGKLKFLCVFFFFKTRIWQVVKKFTFDLNPSDSLKSLWNSVFKISSLTCSEDNFILDSIWCRQRTKY